MNEICGQKQRTSLMYYDRNMRYWKTYQPSFLLDISDEYSATWPKAGMTLAGAFYRQPKWERRISAIASSLFATPNTLDGMPPKSPKALHKEMTVARQGRSRPANLRDQISNAKNWPTPTKSDYRSPNMNPRKSGQAVEPASGHALPAKVGGQLNPTWVEWLMGWPLGWTDLKPLEMDKCQSVQPQPFYCWLETHKRMIDAFKQN